MSETSSFFDRIYHKIHPIYVAIFIPYALFVVYDKVILQFFESIFPQVWGRFAYFSILMLSFWVLILLTRSAYKLIVRQRSAKLYGNPGIIVLSDSHDVKVGRTGPYHIVRTIRVRAAHAGVSVMQLRYKWLGSIDHVSAIGISNCSVINEFIPSSLSYCCSLNFSPMNSGEEKELIYSISFDDKLGKLFPFYAISTWFPVEDFVSVIFNFEGKIPKSVKLDFYPSISASIASKTKDITKQSSIIDDSFRPSYGKRYKYYWEF